MAQTRASKSAPGRVDADARMLILSGKDRFLQDEHLRVLREALQAKHGADGVDTVRFDGMQGARVLADVLDECRSMGLMQPYKIVVLDAAEQVLKSNDDEDEAPPTSRGKKRGPVVKSARELLEAYAAAPSESATLVLRASTWRPGNLDKAVERVGAVIKCEPPRTDQAVAWVQKRAQARHKTSIDPASAAMLVESIGTDLGRLDTELEKLAVAAGGDGQPITRELVGSMVGMSREDDFWAIQSALLTGSAADSLRQLRELIDVSRHDPVPLTFSCVQVASKVHAFARRVAAGESPQRISGDMRLWGAMQEGVPRAAMALGPAGAAELLKEAIATDAANKSGLGDPERNIERLCVRFAEAMSGGRSAARV